MRAAVLSCLWILAGVLGGGAASAWGVTPPLKSGKEPSQAAKVQELKTFDFRKAPTPADWRYFLKAPERQREDLWTAHAKTGVKLASWSWQWRLGWVRACGKSDRPYCGVVLEQALFDKAMVVRADSATRLGNRYEGSGSSAVAELLGRAYANPKNLRHGKPLYVQQRILYALRQVGGGGVEAGKRLAQSHAVTKVYWARLVGEPI
jgi:hypothetical protein